MGTSGFTDISCFCPSSLYANEDEPRQCLRRQLAGTRDFSNTSQCATALGLVLQGVVFVFFLAFPPVTGGWPYLTACSTAFTFPSALYRRLGFCNLTHSTPAITHGGVIHQQRTVVISIGIISTCRIWVSARNGSAKQIIRGLVVPHSCRRGTHSVLDLHSNKTLPAVADHDIATCNLRLYFNQLRLESANRNASLPFAHMSNNGL